MIADFHQNNNKNVKVIGFDLVDQNITAMKKGTIDFLISQRPIFQGEMAVETFFNHFIYKKTPEEVITVALHAGCQHCTTVSLPFHFDVTK